MYLSDDVCEAFVPPFIYVDVPGETAELEDDVERGMAAGYPEFLCKVELGLDTLYSWLLKVENFVCAQILIEGASLGKVFTFSGVKIHGLSFWYALSSAPHIRKTRRILNLWKRLIGLPILEFFEFTGFNPSISWIENGPPCWDIPGSNADLSIWRVWVFGVVLVFLGAGGIRL